MSFFLVLLPLLSLTFLAVQCEETYKLSIVVDSRPPVNVSSVNVNVPAVNTLTISSIPIVPSSIKLLNISNLGPFVLTSASSSSPCRSLDALSGTPCIVSNCGRYRTIDCNQANDKDLESVFATYSTTFGQSAKDSNRSVPLAIRLNGGAINKTIGLFSPLADALVKLELNQVAMPTILPESSFADLKNLVSLNLIDVVTDTMSKEVFKGLNALQSLSIDAPSALRLMQPAALDTSSFPALKCLKVNITSPRFLCDCEKNTWLQRSVINSPTTINQTKMWNDVYSFPDDDNDTAIACSVYVVCAATSNEPFRRNMAGIDLAAACSVATTSTTTVANTTTTTPTTTTTTAAARALPTAQLQVAAMPRNAGAQPLLLAFPALLAALALCL